MHELLGQEGKGVIAFEPWITTVWLKTTFLFRFTSNSIPLSFQMRFFFYKKHGAEKNKIEIYLVWPWEGFSYYLVDKFIATFFLIYVQTTPQDVRCGYWILTERRLSHSLNLNTVWTSCRIVLTCHLHQYSGLLFSSFVLFPFCQQ